MNEELLFNQLSFVRSLTLKSLNSTPESKLDAMPEGAINTIRWHLGHIYTAQALLVTRFAGYQTSLPNTYITCFAPKTKPSDWVEVPPTINEMKDLLERQPQEIEGLLRGKVNEKLIKNFLTGSHGEFTTVQELLTFSIYHEGHHLGAINMLKRTLNISF
jgi:uncharacterized damage-inducible protein DinB